MLLLVFSFKAIEAFRSSQRLATVIEFEEKLKSIVDLLEGDYGSVQQLELRVPDDVDTVCFIDLSKKEALLKSTIVEAYPAIKRSIEQNVQKNTFLLSKTRIRESFYPGNLCLSSPYYKCIDTSDHYLKILVKGKQNCVDIIKPLQAIKINNIKNMSKYATNPILMIEETAGQSRILQLVPVAIWNNKAGGITSYPYFVYFQKGTPTANDFTQLLTKHPNAGELRFFGQIPGVLVPGDRIKQDSLEGYSGYWDTMVDVVVISSSDTEGALVSSLFASFLVAPMITLDAGNYGMYTNYLKDTRVYIIDKEELDGPVRQYIDNNAKEVVDEWDYQDLQTQPELNPYVALMSQILPSIYMH
ncbi:MAG: hypothetical protein V1837_08220 [Candidatus Woesearchaeota archaeon]